MNRFRVSLIATVCCAGLIGSVTGQDEVISPLPAPDTETIEERLPLGETPPADDWLFESEVVEFVGEKPSLGVAAIEAVPTALSWPDESLARWFGWMLHMEHVRPETDLSEEPLGMQPIPPRPPLLVEWNERFLGTGFLEHGLETPTGAVWRPAIWVFGQFRTAIQYYEPDPGDTISEWANRLDLFGQVNLTGTERLLVGLRPLDEERGDRRDFVGYDFDDGTTTDAWNARFQTLFFEGDLQELFPMLDPYDFIPLDWSFSVGRMPLLAQQGLLVNEDALDAITLTRDTLSGHGILDLRATAVYAWRGINRNSPLGPPNDFDPQSRMVALLTETDIASATINVDSVFVDGSERTGDLFAFGTSLIRRWHGFHNTYNSSLHLLASYPTQATTVYADQGELLFGQFSWTPHGTNDLVYLNTFWAIDQFTSPARGPLQGGPLGQTGILFAGPQLGQLGAPLNVQTNNVAGASLGYQLFYDETRKQIITELGGFKDTQDSRSRGAVGWATRYQAAAGQHQVFIVDGFITKREGGNTSPGARAEWLIKF